MFDPRSITLGVISETPISFDGQRYFHSPNEGIYLDGLASRVRELIIYTYAFRQGDADYDNTATYSFVQPNIRIVEIPLARPGFLFKLRKVWQLLLAFVIIVFRSREWDVAYAFIPGYNAAFAALAFRVFRRPYFVYLASDWPEEAELLIPVGGLAKRLLVRPYRRFVHFLQDAAIKGALFTLTAGTDLCERYGLEHRNVHETVPRLTWSEFALFDRPDTCTSDRINLLFVANLLERKGGTYVLNALSLLRRRTVRDFRCVLVGWGPCELSLRQQARDLGIEHCMEFTGHLTGQALTKRFREADIFLFASFSGEGFPRVLYEAMSQALPIVSTNICGIPRKLAHRKEVLFVPPKDANAIADAVLEIVDDRALRTALMKSGLAFMLQLIDGPKGDAQVIRILEEVTRSDGGVGTARGSTTESP